MQAEIENERKQLLEQWAGRVGKKADWISSPLFQVERIFDASQGNEDALRLLNSRLRQFHDKLGYKAKHSLKQGGLCAGAIFRTEQFIRTQERSGAKKGP